MVHGVMVTHLRTIISQQKRWQGIIRSMFHILAKLRILIRRKQYAFNCCIVVITQMALVS